MTLMRGFFLQFIIVAVILISPFVNYRFLVLYHLDIKNWKNTLLPCIKSHCFSYDSSSVGCNVSLYVCLQGVVQKYHSVVCVLILLLFLYFRILKHCVVLLCIFSCGSSSIVTHQSVTSCIQAMMLLQGLFILL